MTPSWAQAGGAVIGRQLLTVATILSITFPYVQVLPIGSYTQPYALVLGSVVLAVTRLSAFSRMRWTDAVALASLAVVGLGLFIVSCFPYRNVQEYKYLLSYLSPIIIASACFSLMEWDRRLVAFLVAASAVVWFWIALAQTLLNPGFMTGLLGEWAAAASDIAASGRGVMALAPEPTHHAFHMLLLAGCIVLLGRHRWVLILCVVDVLLLARSASGALIIGLAIAISAIIYRPRLAMLLGAVVAALFALNVGSAILELSGGNRFLTLIGRVLQSPLAVILDDYSTNIRVGGALVGFMEAAWSLLTPHGMSFDLWTSARLEMLGKFPYLMDLSTVGVPSGYGVLLFQAGLLVAPFLLVSTRRMILAETTPLLWTIVLCVPLVFVFQYYFSAPQFALAYGCAMYLWQNRQRA